MNRLAVFCLLSFQLCVSPTEGNFFIGGAFKSFDVHSSNLVLNRSESACQNVAAFMMAIDEINNKSDRIHDSLLSKYDLKPVVSVGQIFARSFPINQWFDGASAAIAVHSGSSRLLASIGTGSVDFAASASTSLNNWGILTTITESSSSSFANKEDYPLTTQIVSSESFEVTYLLKLVAEKYGWRKVSVLFSSDNFGIKSLSAVVGAEAASSVTFHDLLSIDPIQPDFSTQISEAKLHGAKIFVLLISSATAARFLVQGFNEMLFPEGTQILTTSSVLTDLVSEVQALAGSSAPSILRGLMATAPNPRHYFTTFAGQSFIKRFRALPPTISIDASTGKQVCSSRTDESSGGLFGVNSLYGISQNVGSSDILCLGFESFESFHQNGSNIDPNVLYTYDAVYAAAEAIDHLLRSGYSASNITGASLYSYMTSTAAKFGPLSTGNISFSGPGGGIRKTGLAFKLLNYQPSLSSTSTLTSTRGDYSEHGLAFVGEYTDSAGWLLCGRAADEAEMAAYGRSQCSDPVYRTAGGGAEPPQDAPPYIMNRLSAVARRCFIAFASLGCAVMLAFTGFVLSHWSAKQIKSSQPRMLLVILLGSFLGLIKVFLAAFDVTTGSCVAQMWFEHLCFRLVVRSQLLKLWRVHKVFNATNFKRVTITENTVLKYTALDVLILTMLLIPITAVMIADDHVVSYVSSEKNNQVTLTPFCSADSSSIGVTIVSAVLYSFEGFYLVAALWYTYLTRKVPSSINETHAIAPGLLLIALGIVAIIVVKFTLALDPNQDAVLINVTFLCLIVLGSVKYFSAKVWEIYKVSLDLSMLRISRNAGAGSRLGKRGANKIAAMICDNRSIDPSRSQMSDSDVPTDDQVEVQRLLDTLTKEKTVEGKVRLCHEQIAQWKGLLLLVSEADFEQFTSVAPRQHSSSYAADAVAPLIVQTKPTTSGKSF